jgi:hypothetical protein
VGRYPVYPEFWSARHGDEEYLVERAAIKLECGTWVVQVVQCWFSALITFSFVTNPPPLPPAQFASFLRPAHVASPKATQIIESNSSHLHSSSAHLSKTISWTRGDRRGTRLDAFSLVIAELGIAGGLGKFPKIPTMNLYVESIQARRPFLSAPASIASNATISIRLRAERQGTARERTAGINGNANSEAIECENSALRSYFPADSYHRPLTFNKLLRFSIQPEVFLNAANGGQSTLGKSERSEWVIRKYL